MCKDIKGTLDVDCENSIRGGAAGVVKQMLFAVGKHTLRGKVCAKTKQDKG